MGLIADIASGRRPPTPFASATPYGATPYGAASGSFPFGIFGNLLGEAKDIVVGLGGLVGEAGHDIGVGVANLIPGEQSIERGGYHLDDILWRLPGAVGSDYAARYGPLARGDIGGFAGQVYERPLSFLLDVFGLGAVAGKGAQLAARTGTVSRGLGALSTARAAEAAGEVGALARTLRDVGPLTGLVERTLPKPTARIIGNEVETGFGTYNPVKRLLVERPFQRATTYPIEELEREVGQLRAIVEGGGGLPAEQARLAQLSRTLDQARAVGLERIDRPFMQASRLRRYTDRLIGQHFQAGLRHRDTDLAAFDDALRPLAESGIPESVAEAELQRLSVSASAPWLPVVDEFGDVSGFGPHSETPYLAASSGAMGVASRSGSAAASPGSLTQAPSLQASIGAQGSVMPKVRSTSPLASQYLGSEESIIGRARPPLHSHSTVDGLLAASAASEQGFRSALEGAFGPQAIARTRVKGLDRLNEKLTSKAAVQGGAPEDYLGTIKDALGGRVVVGSWRELQGAVERLRGIGQVLEIDNYVRRPHQSGYHGVHVGLRLADGTVAEVQIHTPLSLRVSEALHPSYAIQRSLYGRIAAMRRAGHEVPDALRREYALTDAYVRRQGEPVLREIEEQMLGRGMSPMDRAMENIRLLAQEKLTNPMIQRGLLTPAEAMERAYLPLRVASGARYDYTAGGFVGGLDTVELDRLLDAAGTSAPVYFPHVDVRHLNFSDFISLSKARVGAARKPGYTRRSTGYLLERGLYVRDPVEAYRRRAAQAVRFDETYRFVMDVARRYGRPISAADAIDPATEAVFAPEGLIRFFRSKLTFDDALNDVRAAVASEDESLAQALGAVLGPVQEEIGEEVLRTGVGVTRRGLELYAIPRAVAERLEAHVRPLLGPAVERNVRLFWDTPTNAWRGLVLAGSPRWVVNNLLGNLLFLKMQGGRVRDVVAQFQASFRERMATVPGIASSEGGFFSASAQYLPKRGSAGLTQTGQALEALGQTRPARILRSIGERMRAVNAAVEDAFRRASYLTALERAQLRREVTAGGRHFFEGNARLERLASSGASDDVVREALEEVNYFFNDYARATPFGRQVIRRFVAPFFSFYRHVLRLSLSWPIDYPLRAEVLRGLTLVSNDLQAEYGPMPPWAQGAVPLGGDPASMALLSTRGANPFTTLFQAPLSLLHPMWKLLYEQSTGRSAFTGRRFSAPDVVTPFGSEQQFRIVRDEAGNPIDAIPIERVAPSLVEHLLQQVPQYDLAKDLAAGGATYSTSDLLAALSGSGVIRDETGAPLYPSSIPRELLAFAGLPTFETDIAAYQQRLAELRDQALRTYLSRAAP